MQFPIDSPYRRLARVLDDLPNRFPPAADESDLRLLACLFSLEEAGLAANLSREFEQPAAIATRSGQDMRQAAGILKEMARKGLIAFGRTADGRAGFALLPFVVGIYENQNTRIDAELAQRFEDYFHQAFAEVLRSQPAVHRVVPVGEAVKSGLAVEPFESASSLVDRMQSWGVIDCICRKQKALIGQGCDHPLDVCMVLSDQPGVFTGDGEVRALTHEEAHATLRRSAEAGLVHCVSNNQRDLWYICNCCTCSCGVLRGMAELGISGVVAHSAFICQVDTERCAGCEECLPACSFQALHMQDTMTVDELHCAGCGLCVPRCPQDALALVRRGEQNQPPLTEEAWRDQRDALRAV